MIINKYRLTTRIATVTLGILLLVPAWAAEETVAPPQKAPSFWKVEGKENVLWLFGSIHLLTESHYPLAEAVEEAFEKSPNLVVEVDVVNADPQALQQLVMTAGMLPAGTTLKDVLGEEQYAQASKLAAASGYDLNNMITMRSWLIAMVLAMAEYAKMGYTPDQGVETYFLTRARNDEKSIVELETLQSQLDIFIELDEKAQVAALMQTLEQLDTMDEQIEEIIDAWESGSLDELEETLLKEFADYPHLYSRLVTDRNREWAKTLSRMLEQSEQDHFVVVGALHMVGKEGVVNLLQKKGYKVTPQ